VNLDRIAVDDGGLADQVSRGGGRRKEQHRERREHDQDTAQHHTRSRLLIME
jgi:hypothetical protein